MFLLTRFVGSGLNGDNLNPFVKIHLGKQTMTTKVVKNTTEPLYQEFFFHILNDLNVYKNIQFEVLSSKIGKDRFLGQCGLEILKLAPEVLYDFWLTLYPQSSFSSPSGSRRMSIKATTRGSQSEIVTGKLHIRVILSAMSGVRPRAGPKTKFEFLYDNAQFKTGDVIAYSGTGMLASLTKLLSNSDFSQLGIVLVLPNLYTHKPELYVAEVTPNYEGMIDPFAERPKKAVCVFRFFERLHQYHGGNIILLPLKSEMSIEAANRMVSWIWQVHSRGGLPLDLAGQQVQFLKKEMAFRLDRPEIQTELCELSASLFIHRCLLLADQIPSDTPALAGGLPIHVMQLPCFQPMKPLRVKKPTQSDLLTPSSYPASSQTIAQASGLAKSLGELEGSAPSSPSLKKRQTSSSSPSLHNSPRLKDSPRSGHSPRLTDSPRGSPRLSESPRTANSPRDMFKPSPSASPRVSGARSSPTGSPRVENDPLVAKKPTPILEKQISVLQWSPSPMSNSDQADVLTVDINSLISDLRNVQLESLDPSLIRGNHFVVSDEPDEDEQESEDKSDEEEEESAGSEIRRGPPPMQQQEKVKKEKKASTQEESEQDFGFGDLDVAGIDLGKLDVMLVEETEAKEEEEEEKEEDELKVQEEQEKEQRKLKKEEVVKEEVTKQKDAHPSSEIILNAFNYLPGMELVRLSEGGMSLDQATALIQYKQEHLGGIFWSFQDLEKAMKHVGLQRKAMDVFAKKPSFPPKLLSMLAPQVAHSVRCEMLYDSGAIFKELIELITDAGDFVHVSVPELSHPGVIEALREAVARGVEVRVMVGTEKVCDIEGAMMLAVDPNSFLSAWMTEHRKKAVEAGVAEEFVQLQDLSRRSLQGHAFPVRLRRCLVCVDGQKSIVGSFSATVTDWHESAALVVGISAGRLVERAFASMWCVTGGEAYDWQSEDYAPLLEADGGDYPDSLALYLSFPGNPCNVIQKQVLEALSFSRSSLALLCPHFTDPALHGQLRVLNAKRLAQLTIVTR